MCDVISVKGSSSLYRPLGLSLIYVVSGMDKQSPKLIKLYEGCRNCWIEGLHVVIQSFEEMKLYSVEQL